MTTNCPNASIESARADRAASIATRASVMARQASARRAKEVANERAAREALDAARVAANEREKRIWAEKLCDPAWYLRKIFNPSFILPLLVILVFWGLYCLVDGTQPNAIWRSMPVPGP